MSRRLPTRLLSRSASSSIAARNSLVSSSVQCTSSWRRLLTAALIDASGVRRSWETAARMAVRNSLTSHELRRLLHLALELPATYGHGDRRRERRQHPPCLRRQLRLPEHEDVRLVELDRLDAVLGPLERRLPGGSRHGPRGVGISMHHRHRGEPEGRAEVLDEARQGIVLRHQPAGQASQRLRLSAAPGCLGPQSRGAVDEHAHHHRDEDEHEDREEVLGLRDRERADRRREVPVRRSAMRRSPRRPPARVLRSPRSPPRAIDRAGGCWTGPGSRSPTAGTT